MLRLEVLWEFFALGVGAQGRVPKPSRGPGLRF